MRRTRRSVFIFVLCSFLMFAGAHAQVTPGDYERAANIYNKYKGLALDVADSPVWIKGTHKFIY